jgi:predicted dinucleotide-binding enzyme
MKKTVAFIGVKNPLAAAMAEKLAQYTYRVLLVEQDTAVSKEACSLILSKNPNADIESVSCAYEGSWEADIIILSSDDISQETIALKIKEVVTGKVLITFSREFNLVEQLKDLLPHTKIVNAFYKNTSQDFSEKNTAEIKVLISGNDTNALDIVSSLVKDLGFEPVQIGLPY